MHALELKTVNGRHVYGVWNGEELVFEVKSMPNILTGDAPADRTVTGIPCVMGNLDQVRDRLMPGIFTKSIQERFAAGRVRYLWAHDQSQPPIAVITKMREMGRSELPAEVTGRAPDATGALEVTRKYFEFPQAEAVYQNVTGGGLNEQSIGFKPVPDKVFLKKSAPSQPDGEAERQIHEGKLYEISDVQFGANEATVSSVKAEHVENWTEFLKQIKDIDITGEHRQAFEALHASLKKAFEQGAEPPADQAAVKAARDAQHSLTVTGAKLKMFLLEA